MKRPSDQVKLLLVGFLRTVSALATSQSRFGAVAALSTTVSASSNQYNYYDNSSSNSNTYANAPLTLRIACVKDVSSISACNLACLPENYNNAFYSNHIRQWPDLAIVAVIDRSNCDVDSGFQNGRKAPHLNYHPPAPTMWNNNFNRNSINSSENRVVAYVLGKVEERPVSLDPSLDDIHSLMGGHPRQFTSEFIGHVTSLAVLEPFRRQGLAAAMMNQLHYHMEQRNNLCTLCGLHVRKSNIAAARLYEKFGYSITEIIPAYYQDGEDACYMTRPLSPVPEHDQSTERREEFNRAGFLGNIMFRRRNTKSSSSFFLRPHDSSKQQPWEYGPANLQLPRPVGRSNQANSSYTDRTGSLPQNQEEHHAAAEYMTGAM